MDIRRIVIYIGIALVSVLIWNTWQKDYGSTATQKAATSATATSKQSFAPQTFNPSSATTPKTSKTPSQPSVAFANTGGARTRVVTDVLNVVFNTEGGNIIEADLPKYPISLKNKAPIKILNPDPSKLYVAESGITNTNAKGESAPVQFAAPVIQRQNGQTLVRFQGQTENGLSVEKTYELDKGSYAIRLTTQVKNTRRRPWEGSFYDQLIRRNVAVDKSFQNRSYDGAAISTPDTPYKKLPFKTLNQSNVSENIQSGWIAMQQEYFLSAWVPPKDKTYHYYSHVIGKGEKGKNNVFTLGYVSPKVTLAGGASAQTSSVLYVGPEIASQLKPIAKGLSLTIDYGFLWFFSVPIFWVMQKIHAVVGNWGWTIVLITALIKLLFFHLSNKSYRSMAKMRDLQPRLQALKDRYGSDRQALGKATMEFYKKEKVNPMGGCLPMLVQIPVFIALYYVLIESVQLRQAPFILWIHDLSVRDPYYVLPILMGASMFLQQKLSPPPPDPTHAKVMLLMPVVFTVFFLNFPAGLVLYWLVNNLLSVAQQWWIMKSTSGKSGSNKALSKSTS